LDFWRFFSGRGLAHAAKFPDASGNHPGRIIGKDMITSGNPIM